MLYTSYENNLQWHERDLANSSSERIILPQFYILLEYIIIKSDDVFSNLYVNKEKMAENISNAGGLPMAEAFVIALGKTDLGRQEAHELVRQISMEAETNKITFNEAISNNSVVKEYLDGKTIAKTLQPENYIGHSEEIINNVLDAL